MDIEVGGLRYGVSDSTERDYPGSTTKRWPRPMQPNAVVALDGVSLSLNRQLVFGIVSLEIPRASVVSVRGTNGSGKTSLLRLLCGVCAPTTGTRLGPSSDAACAALTSPLR